MISHVQIHVALAATIGLAILTSASVAVEFIPLGGFDGRSVAHAISGDGSVVVGESANQAFRWTRETGMIPLGGLPGGTREGTANAVSYDGSVIGGDLPGRAFRWTESGGMALIEGTSSLTPISANAVSADGRTVAGLRIQGNSIVSQSPYHWTESTGLMSIGLGTPGTAWDGSGVDTISADGATVYGHMVLVPTSFPALWNEETGATVFFDDKLLGGIGASISDASADGSAFVGTVRTSGFGGGWDTAYRWTEAGIEHLHDLVPAPGLTGDRATGISADGQIISGAFTSNLEPVQQEDVIAGIWDETRGWQGIRQILVDSGIDMDGWHLTTGVRFSLGTYISDDGLVVAGTGINPRGDREAWLADLSNPTPLPGDYDASLVVDQGDLDLVLLHWGEDGEGPPDGWIRNLPRGLVDQEELDAVLLNWGAVQNAPGIASAAVPEPGAVSLILLAVLTWLFQPKWTRNSAKP